MVKKIAFSFLTAILVLAIFVVLSFSGLFRRFETTSYNAHILARYKRQLVAATNSIQQFHTENNSRFEAIAAATLVRSLFAFTIDRETIQQQTDLFGSLVAQEEAVSFIRVFDSSGERLWFSSRADDILSQTDQSRRYVSIADLSSEYHSPREIVQSEKPLLFDPQINRLLYRYVVNDQLGIPLGNIVFYVSSDMLSTALIRNGILDIDERISILADGTLLLNDNRQYGDAVREAIQQNKGRISDVSDGFLIVGEEETANFVSLGQVIPQFGDVVFVIPEDALVFLILLEYYFLHCSFVDLSLFFFCYSIYVRIR